jgi:hypothetical protein
VITYIQMTVVAKNFNQLLTQMPADAGPAIAGNWVAGYDFADNLVASYDVAGDVAGTWGAGYGVAGDVLPTTGSLFMLTISISTFLYYMFL